jgi:outer membrane receptor protein involved in Fe transport
MKSIFLVLVSFFLSSFTALYAQTTVRGKITDEKGETVVGATIVLKSSPTTGTITDFDGNYSIKIAGTTQETLVISYISYKTVEVVIDPMAGQTVVKNISLVSDSKILNEVEVVAKASRERDSYIEKMKMNSSTTIDYISSETIKKTGDSNVGNALARVSGVSTTSSGLVTVRGIGDRYVKTTLNNAIIPTLDPFTNNLKLDIFPTTLIDNVIVSKTSQSDFQSDWAGAYISVSTKDFPESLMVTAETSIGYNNQSTFKDVITTSTSNTDWLGYDDGYRDFDHSSFVTVNTNPTQYDELVALGLGAYYESLGVTTSWSAGSQVGETYFKLGLVQLGLLGPAQFNDPAAIAAAKDAFINDGYKNLAFQAINAPGTASATGLKNNWSIKEKQAPLDFSQSLVIGNQIELFKRPLGFVVGGRYASQYRFDPDGISQRLDGQNEVDAIAYEKTGVATNGWSGLINLNYKVAKNNSIGVLFMPNQTGTNKMRDAIDFNANPSFTATLNKDQFYEQRKQYIYQFKSENYIPSIKTKVDLNVSYTDGESRAPDFKRLTYFQVTSGEYIIDGAEEPVNRYFRELDDNIFDSQLTFEVPLKPQPGLARKLRFGASYSKNDRSSGQYDYAVTFASGGSPVIPDNDLDVFFAPNNFSLNQDSTGNYFFENYYKRDDNPSNFNIGYREVSGAFAMVDYNLNFAIRLTAGIRVERGLIFTDVEKYDESGYVRDDPRRKYVNDIFIVNAGNLDEISILPNIGAIYNFNADADNPFNLRVNYGKSVARPGIREMSETILYDFEVRSNLFGNANLKQVSIDNYDLRLERYFKSGNNISASLFYKDFKNHIELVRTTQGFTWQNVDQSEVYGIEIEGGLKLFKKLDLKANITYVESNTEFVQNSLTIVNGIKEYSPVDTIKRSMYGQAPYVVNLIAGYDLDSLGLSISMSYNLQGEKLVITNVNGNPDVYEMPRHILDFKVAKQVGKYFNVGLKVQNILNEPVRRSYLFDDASTIDYDSYRFGSTYTLSLAYKLSR